MNTENITTNTLENEDDFVTTGYVDVTDVVNNKEITMDDINKLTKYIHTEGAKEALNNELDKVVGAKAELLSSITGLDNEKDFIQDKLDSFETVESLKEYLKSDENVTNFYVNPETGTSLDLSINIEDPKRAMDFKRELLIYMKTTDVAHAAIDREYEELEQATSQMSKDISDACITLSDNVLAYIYYLKENADKCADENMKKEILESAKYIESGYTFEVMQDVINEYPSVLRNTVKELIGQNGIERIGKKYTDKLKRYDIKVSLIPLVSNGADHKSIEEFVLIRDEEFTVPDLFIYSAIRFFAMANWDDSNIKKFHASLALVMKKLLSNQLDESIKEDVITNMIKYISQFNAYIK